MDKPRTKITEPMSAEDRATLQRQLDHIHAEYQDKYDDLRRHYYDDMEGLEKAINKAVIAHAESQAQD